VDLKGKRRKSRRREVGKEREEGSSKREIGKEGGKEENKTRHKSSGHSPEMLLASDLKEKKTDSKRKSGRGHSPSGLRASEDVDQLKRTENRSRERLNATPSGKRKEDKLVKEDPGSGGQEQEPEPEQEQGGGRKGWTLTGREGSLNVSLSPSQHRV
jgi:hypothetical protein